MCASRSLVSVETALAGKEKKLQEIWKNISIQLRKMQEADHCRESVEIDLKLMAEVR